MLFAYAVRRLLIAIPILLLAPSWCSVATSMWRILGTTLARVTHATSRPMTASSSCMSWTNPFRSGTSLARRLCYGRHGRSTSQGERPVSRNLLGTGRNTICLAGPAFLLLTSSA